MAQTEHMPFAEQATQITECSVAGNKDTTDKGPSCGGINGAQGIYNARKLERGLTSPSRLAFGVAIATSFGSGRSVIDARKRETSTCITEVDDITVAAIAVGNC